MKRQISMAVTSVFVVYCVLNCSGSVPEPTPLVKPFSQNPEGRQLYNSYCALCHGENGKGYLADEAPALADPDFLSVASDRFIAENTRRGRPGTPMSAWGVEYGGALTPDDLAAVVAHMRAWQTESPIDVSDLTVNGNAKRGYFTYAVECETCHGYQGKGAKAMTLNNPVFQETVTDGFIRVTVDRGRRSTKIKGFGGKLKRRQINDVVAYVKQMPQATTFSRLLTEAQTKDPSILEQNFILHSENPPAQFTLIDDRFVPAEAVYNAYSNKESFIFIDARPYSDFLLSHIEGAVSVPFYNVEKQLNKFPKDLWIVAYCGCPHAISGRALDILRAHGFEKSAVLNEGFYVWGEKGYPVVGN